MAYDDSNVFARILRGEIPAERVYDDEHTVAIMDSMPQADGHTLVLPKAPAENLFALPDDAAAALMPAVRRVADAVRRAFSADGVRLMQLNGAAAGQSVFHFHMHVIPCHAGQPIRRHGGGEKADAATLRAHAELIREALREG